MNDMTTEAQEAPEPRNTELEDVKRWDERIESTIRHDEEPRKQMAKDRRMARGDSGFEVDANLPATYIDILGSFLYARNPQPEVMPARSTEPPDVSVLRDAAGMDGQMPPEMAAMQFEQMQQAYRTRQRDNKAFAETCELIIERLWKDGDLKKRGKRFVRAALTVGMGVLKAAWQERRGQDPIVAKEINDLQENIKRIKSLQQELEKPSPEHDANVAELERQIQGLQAKVEVVEARGFAIDFVPSERLIVAPGYAIGEYLDAPWIAHEIPMRAEEAKADFGLTDEQMKGATCYRARKPMNKQETSPNLSDADAKDAMTYVAEGESHDGKDGWVMVREIWDRQSNSVLTMIKGMKRWAKPAWNPCPTTRFYPFFVLCMSEVDGQRYPQSLVARSAKLIDEYNRIGSAEAEHRRRVKPKTMFNAGKMSPEDAAKLASGAVQEMVAINPTNPLDDLGGLVREVAYSQLDPHLYDRSRIVGELERIWGAQEALAGSVSVAKTATEAEIQQGGFQARSDGRRDDLDDVLGELALYTAEVAAHYMTTEDATAIVGPDAFWPQGTGPESLRQFVNVDITAGSSGKPNTSAERQAWATQLPLLQNGIMQIGQLRQSDPNEIADKLEKLLRITAERSGDRLDMDSLVPQSGMGPMLPQPGIPPGAPPIGPVDQPPADPLAA